MKKTKYRQRKCLNTKSRKKEKTENDKISQKKLSQHKIEIIKMLKTKYCKTEKKIKNEKTHCREVEKNKKQTLTKMENK